MRRRIFSETREADDYDDHFRSGQKGERQNVSHDHRKAEQAGNGENEEVVDHVRDAVIPTQPVSGHAKATCKDPVKDVGECAENENRQVNEAVYARKRAEQCERTQQEPQRGERKWYVTFHWAGSSRSAPRNCPQYRVFPDFPIDETRRRCVMIYRMAKADSIKTVAVIGAGTMGNGIAHVFARAGFRVILRDVEQRFLDRGMETIAKNLEREVSKGKITEADKAAALARIQPSTEIVTLMGADFAIEAVPEQRELKLRVLKEADGVLGPGVILATNTSSISISELAAETQRSDRFIGMHFMNPVPVMALVEVIRGSATSDATFETTMALCEKLGKMPVGVNDAPGFVSNRVLMPMINEAAFAVMEGVATPAGVDAVMKLGMNHPMGPLELADLIGLDVCVDILDVLQKGFGDPKYAACSLLKEYVAAGRLGRKSGHGFYKY